VQRLIGPRTRFLIVLACGGWMAACRREPSHEERSRRQHAAVTASQAAAPAPRPAAANAATAQERDEPDETPPAQQAEAVQARLRGGDLADLGPAAPAAATPRGAVLITRRDEVVLVPLQRGKRGDELGSSDRPAQDFASRGRAPTEAGGHVYWVAKGRLLRSAVAPDAIAQVLTTDARDGTRASAAQIAGQSVAAYIAREGRDETLVARLWAENKPPVTVSPAGSAANSVSLASDGRDLVVVSLEGRTAMSPLHARTVRMPAVSLDQDVVVWVGGTAQSMTELTAVRGATNVVWAFLPIERDVTTFGLARIQVALPPRMAAETNWRVYPNGLDPAPVAAATICGRAAVLYVRPSEKAPRSPQELHLALVEKAGLGASTVVATSGGFVDVSLAALDGGALVVYVADHRTWGRVLRCTSLTK
jgi:hypothetical protein